MGSPLPPGKVSFQEFQLYYQSAELVTDRRLAMNRWNYSVLAATLVAIALVLQWSIGKQSHIFVGICGIVVLCLTAILLCTYWVNQIADFKTLNAVKFKILNEMAPLIEFEGPTGPSVATSYKPFDREWADLQATQSLASVQASGASVLQVLSASRAEYFIPKAFRVLFVTILLAVLVFAVAERKAVFGKVNPFDGVSIRAASATSGELWSRMEIV